MHRILHITDPDDPLAAKVRAVARGRVEIESVQEVPASFTGFDALLIGDSPLSVPISSPGKAGPKFIQLTRGHHKHIDPTALIAEGITVAGASPVLAPYVARHALELAISALESSSKGAAPDKHRSALTGKTVGVVGFGRIGQAMAELCTSLGATVIYSDVRTAQHGSAAAIGVRRSTLDLLLSKSDIVSLHVQWGPTSNPLIGARELRLMGRGSVLVNTADARLVDGNALATALKSGRIKAAPEPKEVRSADIDEKVAEFVVANIETALFGGEPAGVIEIIDFPRAGDPAFWSSKMSPRTV